MSAVGLFPAADYAADFAEIIGRGLRELGIDVRGRHVLLKPNMVEYESNTAINTHPLVVAGAALALRSAGAADVVVGEGPGHRRDIEYLVTQTGLYDHLREIVSASSISITTTSDMSHCAAGSPGSRPLRCLRSCCRRTSS